MLLLRFIPSWIVSAVIITGCCFLVYAAVQQNYRSSFNDPQIQIAEHAARALETGADPATLLPPEHIDIANDLTPYLIIYDEERRPIAASGTLGGTIPSPPSGVFAFASAEGENRITWEPQTGVRTAIVIRPFRGERAGFVLAGRLMREVEKRERRLFLMTLAAWAGLLVATFMLQLLFSAFPIRTRRDPSS